MNFLLSSSIYLVLLVMGVVAGVLLRPQLTAFWRKTKNRLHNQQSSGALTAKAEGASVSDQTNLTALTRDCLIQIKEINTQLSLICKLMDQNQSALANEYRRAEQEINTGLLKLLSSNESFIDSLHRLLQRNLDALNVIADQTEAKAAYHAPQTSRASSYVEGSDGREEMQAPAKGSEREGFASFEDLIDKIKGQVNQASYKGFKSIQTLLEQISEKHRIELDSPSDQVFILFDRNAKSEPTGKAFVMPGSYLGRPWVDWFEMPKGVFERVEATAEPATVARNANGGWNLVKPGSLNQQ
ncbi:MAG TPA: hypothetical protein VJ875_15610 [Pyrinomonadaceae bacterium]|nr:hypothetical protein [Pyrinomonadaceae bacterium]